MEIYITWIVRFVLGALIIICIDRIVETKKIIYSVLVVIFATLFISYPVKISETAYGSLTNQSNIPQITRGNK